MAFDATQINDARINALYRAMEEDGNFNKSMVRDLAVVVPKSRLSSKAAKLKVLDIRNIVGTTDLSYGAIDASSTQIDTTVNDRSYDIQKLSGKMTYARGLEGDVLFDRIKESFVPDLTAKIRAGEDAEFADILKGNGTSGASTDVTVRQLSASSNETWDDTSSDPLDDLEQAVKDTNANLIVLGRNKAFELKRHPDLEKQTGMKYATDDALAEYLASFLSVSNVQVGFKFYHNGAHTATFSAGDQFNEVAYVGRAENILFLDWSGPEFETDEDPDTNVGTLVGRAHSDIVTLDPDLSIAFQDVA